MLDFDKVFRVFMVLSRLEEAAGIDYDSFVELAIEEVEQKLKPGMCGTGHEKLLTQLAASIAYYQYAVAACQGSERIGAYDVSITVDDVDRIDAAKRLRDEYLAAAHALLQDDLFLFGRM